MTAVAITFLSFGCIVLYGGLITTIAISIKCDKK
ncbi:putative membrane protein [Clostridium bornimense]|uniref:Putative membrane protein n=1 Tax=Clostridium bornimense TaxID=1216932 RepID=W6S0L8_9CLOT|nr:MetS family NSS transporter small subunit [Clostridium bornimense]CDM69384.1 putative membrane protein [Clostridium bornimense]